MKLQKKIFYCILILTILLQIVSPTVFSANTSKINYLALGDSIAEGYGLSNKGTQRYSALIAKDKSFSETNKAVSGMTCKEFYEKISTDNSYKTAIENADVITVSIGSNELLKTIIGVIQASTGATGSTGELVIQDASNKFNNADTLERVNILANLITGLTSNETENQLNAGISQYENYWEKSVNLLKDSNATIIATEFYNPYHASTNEIASFRASIEPVITQLQPLSNVNYQTAQNLLSTFGDSLNLGNNFDEDKFNTLKTNLQTISRNRF